MIRNVCTTARSEPLFERSLPLRRGGISAFFREPCHLKIPQMRARYLSGLQATGIFFKFHFYIHSARLGLLPFRGLTIREGSFTNRSRLTYPSLTVVTQITLLFRGPTFREGSFMIYMEHIFLICKIRFLKVVP